MWSGKDTCDQEEKETSIFWQLGSARSCAFYMNGAVHPAILLNGCSARGEGDLVRIPSRRRRCAPPLKYSPSPNDSSWGFREKVVPHSFRWVNWVSQVNILPTTESVNTTAVRTKIQVLDFNNPMLEFHSLGRVILFPSQYSPFVISFDPHNSLHLIIPALQIMKQRLRESKRFVQGNKATERPSQSWDAVTPTLAFSLESYTCIDWDTGLK